MKILVDGQWKDDFLDEYLGEGQVRVAVQAWKNLEKLEGIYFVRSKSIRLLWNYLQEVGWKNVLLKVSSRLGETLRNQKYISIGVGSVLESQDVPQFRPGDTVFFVAPLHPRAMERVVLPAELLRPVPHDAGFSLSSGKLLFFASPGKGNPESGWWKSLNGWSRESGWPLPPDMETIFRRVSAEFNDVSQPDMALPVSASTPVRDVRPAEPPAADRHPGKLRGCLLGYGNFAKTIILPNVKREIAIDRIHEMEPTQIPVSRMSREISYDTAPLIRAGEAYDVYFIAGYHHTHAPLAVQALKKGAVAVVEKPVVTTRAQLRELSAALAESPGKLFSCYQRRYLPFNELVPADLEISQGDPVNYHCIVYEVPLPPRHWYRWPNSRSRLLSNGCHWIDHFLYLNNYIPPRKMALYRAENENLNVTVELQNGAMFTMLLTDHGSERIGMSDYVELRSGKRTARIIRGSTYLAESDDRVIRKSRINKLSVYGRMYRTIARQIKEGQPGESVEQFQVLNGLLLDLEEQLTALKK